MRKLPPLNALRAFEAAARHLSFTRAADELCVTQGAISRHVRKLEDFLGVELMLRNTRQVRLSEAGVTMLHNLTHSFDVIAQTASDVGRLHGKRAHSDLNLLVSSGFAMLWLIPRLSRFQQSSEHPHLRLTTRAGNVDFDADAFDAAIIYGDGNWPGVEVELIFDEHLMPVCAPQLMQGEHPPNTWQNLAHHTLLHSSPDHRDWRTWLTLNGVGGIDPAQGLTFESMDATVRAASLGHGIAICDTRLMHEELNSSWLVTPFEQAFHSARGYYLLYPRECAQRLQIQQLKHWLHEEVDGVN